MKTEEIEALRKKWTLYGGKSLESAENGEGFDVAEFIESLSYSHSEKREETPEA